MQKVAIPVLLILCALLLPAQESNSTGDFMLEDFARPRRLIYFYETEPGALTEYDEFLLYNSILTDISGANPQVVVVESLNREVPTTLAGKEDLARDVQADAWVEVYVAGGLDDLTVRALLYDMTEGERLEEVIIQPGFPVDYRTLARGFWDTLSQAIGERFRPIVEATEVTFSGLPGTEVDGLPTGRVLIGERASAVVVLPTPATYTVQARLAGFVPVTESFYLGSEPASVDLVQLPTYRFAVDSFASSFQFPGLRFRYNIVPGSWFARLGAVTQLFGVYFVPNEPLFASRKSRVSTLYFDGGYLLGELDAFVRYQFALGGFIRLQHEPLGFETDASLGGFHGSAGVEIAPWRRQRFLRNLRLFAEYQPALFLTDDSDDFIDRVFSWNAFPGGEAPLFFGVNWGAFDLRDLHLGVRFAW